MKKLPNQNNQPVQKRGIGSYTQQLDTYSQSDLNDLESVATTIAERAKEQEIPLESDPKTLRHMIGNDLRETVPPQLYTVIAGLTEMIKTLERDEDERKNKSSQ